MLNCGWVPLGHPGSAPPAFVSLCTAMVTSVMERRADGFPFAAAAAAAAASSCAGQWRVSIEISPRNNGINACGLRSASVSALQLGEEMIAFGTCRGGRALRTPFV
ncbi:hypothetical protein BHE74_00022289 [Ensete ventricosum]|nr:hypothetical protein BHE74_00022289 [Ensete ventricosum]